MFSANEARERVANFEAQRRAKMETEVTEWMEKELFDHIKRCSSNGYVDCNIDMGINASGERYEFIAKTLSELGYTFYLHGKSLLVVKWGRKEG